MELTNLGNTGLTVSRLGLGLAALGRPGYMNLGHADDLGRSYDIQAMESKAHAVLDLAWRLGIRYFDTARSYGSGEAFLGSWLKARNIAREAVVIGSKWGYTYTAGWRVQAEKHEIKEHSLQVFLRQIQESKDLLGDQLDLYQIHSATLESGVLENQDVLRALAKLHGAGIKVGLTLTGPKQAETLEKAMEIVIDGQRVFDCVQATWNLLETSVGPTLKAAHDAGMGVIVKEALANGRLTNRNTDAQFARRRQLLEEVAARFETTLDGLALAAVLAQPWADVVLSGAVTEVHLSSNIAAFKVQWETGAAHALQAVAEDPQDYWMTRGGLPWN